MYQADTHITGDIVQLTSKLPMSLRELNLDRTEYYGEGVKAEWSFFCYLETLCLTSLKITGDIVKIVERMPKTLKVLKLYRTECSGEGAKVNWRKLLPDLEGLSLPHTALMSETSLQAWDEYSRSSFD